jgi:hypothetical protein
MRANKAVLLAPKAAFDSFQGKQLMGLPFGIEDHKYGTGTSTLAQVDNEEEPPSWFRNPCLRPPELIAQPFCRAAQSRAAAKFRYLPEGLDPKKRSGAVPAGSPAILLRL